MQWFASTAKITRAAIASGLLLGVLTLALWLTPPDLVRVGVNYSAKIICSNVFIAGRDPEEVLHTDVQAPGSFLLRFMQVSVDRQTRVVRTALWGFAGRGLAVARPGFGCTVVADGDLDSAMKGSSSAPAEPTAVTSDDSDGSWPDGGNVSTTAAFERVVADDVLAGPGIRSVIVVHHGHIVAERYGTGFSAATPLLGWSMTKSVIAGLAGAMIKEGRLALDQTAGWEGATDGREHIRIADLLAMVSGLKFNEAYGAVSDVTRMLYLQPDMAGFARAQPLLHPVGEFWSYSSGSANILSRIVQDAAGPLGAGIAAEKLFRPLGMTSAIIETDEYGTLVGSSYMYATARDWARYAQFLLQGGVWRGKEILPRGYVAMMAAPVAASKGEYGHGLVWLNPDPQFGLPADTFWMEGHDGQSIAIIPSRELIVVRLGLTPSRDHYQPQPLVRALLDAAT